MACIRQAYSNKMRVKTRIQHLSIVNIHSRHNGKPFAAAEEWTEISETKTHRGCKECFGGRRIDHQLCRERDGNRSERELVTGSYAAVDDIEGFGSIEIAVIRRASESGGEIDRAEGEWRRNLQIG